ncbi:alpha/beta hydrolase family protein [Halalkalibacter flavus]|uniref:alpha/beta hydrolase family protein n=1 Tax=Halalkalibacter flavus TaxID=3090668 RepID=UPI002FCACB75
MLLSKIIDYYALHNLHKKRSEEFQFSPVTDFIPKVEERETFYMVDPSDLNIDIHEMVQDYSIGGFRARSSILSNDSHNDYLGGEVFLHENQDSPNVVFVHGWRSTSLDRIKNIFHHRMMGEMKWNMYYFTLPYHFQREPKISSYSGELMISADIERTLQAVKQTIVDLRTLIQWLKKNKKGPVIVIGVSLGGFITNLVSTLEDQMDMLISIFYSNRLSYSIWNTIPGKFIREDLERHGVHYRELEQYWKITEPSIAASKINKDNILLISGKYDQYIHMEDATYLWESWGRPKRLIYPCGHAGIVFKRKRIEKDTLSFIRNRI